LQASVKGMLRLGLHKILQYILMMPVWWLLYLYYWYKKSSLPVLSLTL